MKPRKQRMNQRSPRSQERRDADAVWSAAVLERDGYRCRRCGAAASDAHHIAPKGAWPALRHLLANGVAVCRRCHGEIHADTGAGRREGFYGRENVQTEDAA